MVIEKSHTPQRWWILAACCTVVFAQLSEPHLWIIGPDIPTSAFGTAWREYRFLSNIGVVLFIAFQLLGGLLGDMFGRRRIFMIGAVGSTLANILSLAAWSLPSLTVMRGLTGILGALAFPLALAVVRLTFNNDERKIALLIYAFVTSLGILASLLGIPLEYHFGWRWALVLPIMAGLIGIILARRYLPESKAAGGVGLSEAIATAIWTLVLLLLVFGIITARVNGSMFNPITIAALLVCSVAVLATVFWSRRWKLHGVFEAEGYVPRNFILMMLLVTAVLSFAISGYVLQMYQFFFTVQQYSGFIAGLALAPMVLGNIFTLRLVGRFALTQPRHVVVAVGLGAMGLAALLTSLARPNLPYLFLVPMLVLFGCGFLMASTAWTHFFFSVLPADLSGLSAGINRAAGLFGSAVSGVVLAAIVEVSGMASFSLRLEGLGLTPEQQFEALETLEILLQARVTADELAQSPDALISLGLLSAYRDARSAAISAAMLALAGICLGCGALAWLWLRRAARGAALAGAAEEHSELQEA